MKRIISRLREREDSEHKQMIVKFFLGCLFLTYFQIVSFSQEEVKSIVFVAILYLIIQILFLSWIIINPAIHRVRRSISMFSDIYVTTMILLPLGEVGAPMFSGYLFLSFGYGFRYGNRYLFASALMSAIGFLIVINLNPFWNNHPYLSYGNLVSIGILTLYVSVLISQLHRAVNEAKQANRAKSQFLSNMSHEIRTPLNGVIGTSSLLAKTKLDKKQREFVTTIDSSSQNLLGVINDILDVSKIEEGKINIVENDFDLHHLINSTVALFTAQAQMKGLMLNAYIDSNTPYLLKGDEQHLRQVITNLISNAVKFTDKGRVDVMVSSLITERTNTTILVDVVDTGIGITEDAQVNIFDKFTQADASINRKFGGTGLGTAIAKQLVEEMGGSIHFFSEENKGSTFGFELKLALQPESKEIQDLSSKLESLSVYVLAPYDEKHKTLSRHIAKWSSVHHVNTQKKLLTAINNDDSESRSVIMVSTDSAYNNPEAYLAKVNQHGLFDHCKFVVINDEKINPMNKKDLLKLGYAAVIDSADQEVNIYRALHGLLTGVEFNKRVNNVHSINEQSNRTVLSILVADDNSTNRDVLKNILEYGRHQVTMVENGKLALEMIENYDYDLIIMDMHMPVMGGIEAAKEYYYTQPENGHVPIIILTANATVEAEKKCVDAGVTLYLTKPIVPDFLLEKVNELALKKDVAVDETVKRVDFNKTNKDKEFSLLDIDILDELSRMAKNKAFIGQLIQGYLNDTKQKIEALPKLLEENQIDGLTNLIHTLDGSSRSIGACHLASLANSVERKIKNDDMSSLITSIVELRTVYDITRSALLQYADQVKIESA
jgi:two-component system, sensor histidine kinase RpfC